MLKKEVALVVKNLLANAGDLRDFSSVIGSERSPGGGNGHSLQYSCLENPVDRGAWWATVHRVTQSQTLTEATWQACMHKYAERGGDCNEPGSVNWH